MGVLEETGTIEVGKRADLLVLDGDPLADIINIRYGRWVAIGGRLYACSDLARLAGFKPR
jgi:imidazolonepropionase-like amidohydrolase